MSERAKLAFIGVGSHAGHQHLPNAARSGLAEIHALCDINQGLLNRRAEVYHPAYTTTDYTRILEDPDVDIVVVGTKHDLHVKFAIETLSAGKWAYVEKPVGATVEEMRLVTEAAKKSMAKLGIGHNRRFAPPITKAKELLKQQEGPAFYYHRVMNVVLEKKTGFYANREKLVWEGCHMFDLANFLFDDYPVAVISSGEPLRNNITTVEYKDGSRFCLMMGDFGSLSMEKEYMEIFKGNASITIKDFSDMRIRGVPGEFDRLFPRRFGRMSKEAEEYGADFVEMAVAKEIYDLTQNDPFRIEQGYNLLPTEYVRRPGIDPGKVDEYFYRLRKEAKDVNETEPKEFPPILLLLADKGWASSLDHFIECYLNGEEPQTATALDGAMATLTGINAVESIRCGEKMYIANTF